MFRTNVHILEAFHHKNMLSTHFCFDFQNEVSHARVPPPPKDSWRLPEILFHHGLPWKSFLKYTLGNKFNNLLESNRDTIIRGWREKAMVGHKTVIILAFMGLTKTIGTLRVRTVVGEGKGHWCNHTEIEKVWPTMNCSKNTFAMPI